MVDENKGQGEMRKTIRQFMLWFLVVTGLIIVLAIGGLRMLVWYRCWTPFLDDGPFHGRQRVSVPNRQPAQVFPIYGGMKLLTYDREPNEPAPTVVLKSDEDKVLWSIYAEADGMTETEVSSIRFHNYRQFPFRRTRVVGVVDWTYGREATWWFISKKGDLEEYWFSW